MNSYLTPILLAVILAYFAWKELQERKSDPQEGDDGDVGVERSNRKINLRALLILLAMIPLFAYWQEAVTFLFGSLGFNEDDAVGSFNVFRIVFGAGAVLAAFSFSFWLMGQKFPSLDRYISGLRFREDWNETPPQWRVTLIVLLPLCLSWLLIAAAGMITVG